MSGLVLLGWLLGAASAADGSTLAELYEPSIDPPAARYDGAFDAPPAPHFSIRLPGERLGAGSHTERGGLTIFGDLVLGGSAGSSALHAMSRRDGSEVKQYAGLGPVQSAPVVDGDQLVFTDTGGATSCYNLDGTLLWRHTGVAPILSAPTLSDELVFVSNVEDLIIALERDTGELLWQYRRPEDLTRDGNLALYAAPSPTVQGDTVYVAFSDGYVMAIEAASGDPLWQQAVGEGDYPDVVGGLVVSGDDLYASGYFGPFAAVERSNENVRWRVEAGSAATPLLAPVDDRVMLFHPGSDGKLRAVEARTGDLLWTYDTGRSGALTDISLTEAGLLFGVADGGLYLVDANEGTEVWNYRGYRRLNGISATPVVDGRQVLFVTNAGWLHSMLVPQHIAKPSRRPWDSRTLAE